MRTQTQLPATISQAEITPSDVHTTLVVPALIADLGDDMNRTDAHQVAHRLVRGIWNPYRRQLSRPMQSRQTGRVQPIALDAIARTSRD
jgi:hypothetical protein